MQIFCRLLQICCRLHRAQCWAEAGMDLICTSGVAPSANKQTQLIYCINVQGGDLSFIFQINERSFWSCVLKAHKYSINVAVTAVMNTVTDFKVFMGLKCILHLLIYVKLAVLNLSQNPTWASICVVFDICTHRKVFER